MKKLCMMMLALCAAVSAAYGGTTYYLKAGATDFSVASSYTKDEAGTQTATTAPGASDEVYVPAGTYAIAGDSASFTTLSGVSRVRPNDGAILEFTIDDTRTFNAPINYNGGYNWGDETNLRCYGKLVKKGNGTLILAASGKTKSASNYYQDYMTQIELCEGTLKLPQYAEKNMYFGDIVMSNGTTLVSCGNMDSPNSGVATYMRSFNGDGIVTNETGRSAGQIFSPYTRKVKVENVFRGRICFPAKLWLQGRFTHYGHDTGIAQQITVENNQGHLNDGYDHGVYSFEDVALLGPKDWIQLYGLGGGLHYFGAVDATINKTMSLYTYDYPAFVDAGWHGGLTFSGSWTVDGATSPATILNVQKWLVLTGSNEVPCKITGLFVDSDFGNTSDPLDSLRTIFTQKLGSGTWSFLGTRSHGGGFAIEEGTLQFEWIDEKGMLSSLGLSTNLTTACSVRNPEYVEYAFTLGSTNASAPEAVFEYTGRTPAASTTRPLVLAGKGGSLSASNGRLTFGGISARDANSSPTLTLTGTGSVVNVARNISDGAAGAKVNVAKDGTGTWALAGDQTFTGDITVKKGTLAIRAPVAAKYADYKWFRLSIAQIGNGDRYTLQMRQISLFDKDGVRQNEGLTLAGPSELDAANYDLTIAAAEIGPGQVYYDKSAAGKTAHSDTISGNQGTLAKAFDGYYSGSVGGLFAISWKTGSSACKPSPSDRSTWIPIVMHLADSANPITHFDIEGFGYQSNNGQNLPTRILLEASHNGFVWEEVYSNIDTSKPLLAQSNTGYNQWISDGVGADANRSRQQGNGMTLSKSGDVKRTYFSWFRLSIAELGTNGTATVSDDNRWNVRQIGLYDKDGNRLNSGLTMAEGPTTANNQTRTILGTVPQAGQVGYDAIAAGCKIKASHAGELNLCFDDVYHGDSAGRNNIYLLTSSGGDLPPNPRARRSWLPIVMHLTSAVELHHFDIQTMDNLNSRSPRRLMLEGSADGTDWYVLYDNATTGEEFPDVPTPYNWWLSDGISASNASHARPAGTGFEVSTSYVPDDAPATQFPDGVNVQVLNGATLTTTAPYEIKSLRVDASGAGTIDGFSFAESGTIDVVLGDNTSKPVALPGTYMNCSGMENIANWTIKFNGAKFAGYRAKVNNGTITVVPRGMMISFR